MLPLCSRAFVISQAILHLPNKQKYLSKKIKKKAPPHTGLDNSDTHIHALRHTQTNTNNGHRQPKPHFVLTITPGLPLHGEGDQDDFGCLPFFFCYFNSPLFWSRTYSADGGATDTGSRAAAATMLARGLTPEIQPSGWQVTSSCQRADHKIKTSPRRAPQNTGEANVDLNLILGLTTNKKIHGGRCAKRVHTYADYY